MQNLQSKQFSLEQMKKQHETICQQIIDEEELVLTDNKSHIDDMVELVKKVYFNLKGNEFIKRF